MRAISRGLAVLQVISVPILSGERAIATLSVLFFASNNSVADAVRCYLGELQATSKAIAADIASQTGN